jgi:hypothetical protein
MIRLLLNDRSVPAFRFIHAKDSLPDQSSSAPEGRCSDDKQDSDAPNSQ